MLALWDGTNIAPAGHGGFAISAQKAQRGLAWWPQQPAALQRFAEVQEPCALAAPASGSDAGAVLLAAGAGVARWHPKEPPLMLRWPAPMALDNHWVVLEPTAAA